jgi:allophanate hydrolase subunit 1
VTDSGASRPGVVTVLPAGEDALLLEVADLDEVLVLEERLRAAVEHGTAPWSRVTDVVPAARTVLLVTRGGSDLAVLRAAALEVSDSLRAEHGSTGTPRPQGRPTAHEVEVAVRYDGPDLHDVARLTGLSPAEVVAAHTGTPWRVAFGGFAPGFAYLVGGDPRLVVPRLDQPRPSVAAG